MMRRLRLVVLAAAFAALGAHGARVVVFGDSWGAQGERAFELMFASRGYDVEVDNQAIGGTTANFWSKNPRSLLDRLDENPDAEYVWLSIGGNDGIFRMLLGLDIDDILRKGIEDTRTFLDPVYAAKPNVTVVQFGYDIVNFEMTAGCRGLGNLIFRKECPRDDIACFNNLMYKLQYDYVEQISTYYRNGFHTSVNLLGTLQASDPRNIPGPYPNPAYYSPADLMNDCIHPTTEGFTVLFDTFWDKFWAGEIGRLGPHKPQLEAETRRKLAILKSLDL